VNSLESYYICIGRSRYLPEFTDMQVFVGGTEPAAAAGEPQSHLEPAAGPITLRHLFTHTSGLGAGSNPTLGKLQITMRQGNAKPTSLAESVLQLSKLPLMAHPGTTWHYASSHDLIGRCIEVWTGVEYSEFLSTNILKPLGMDDTSFVVPESKRDRFTKSYSYGSIPLVEHSGIGLDYFDPTTVPGPSGGLTGTMMDYWKFCQCLLCNLKGNNFEGVRLLGRKTAEWLGTNHLPDHKDMAEMGGFHGGPMNGIGFGLGCAVVVDPAKTENMRSPGEFYWGGMASTAFWIDPQEDIVVVFFTQLVPSGSTAIRPLLRIAVNSALIDAAPTAYAPSTGGVMHRL
jgi:CubicO group peptidase (beta-lactamase class C family)